MASTEMQAIWADWRGCGLTEGAVIRPLAKQFRSRSQLARFLDVDRSRISRWLGSETPDTENRIKVEAMEFALSRLSTFLSPETAMKWLMGINAHLGDRR